MMPGMQEEAAEKIDAGSVVAGRLRALEAGS